MDKDDMKGHLADPPSVDDLEKGGDRGSGWRKVFAIRIKKKTLRKI